MKYLVLALVAVLAFSIEAERDMWAAVDWDRDGLVDTIVPTATYAPRVATTAVVEPAVTVAAPVTTYGGVRTTGYGYGGLTDFNRDGIPDQWEGYNRWGSYPHHAGYGGYTNVVGGYTNVVGNYGRWW